MGTTLENGVYLPSEGERNCYAGLKTNWEILDQKVADVTALQQAVAGALHREIVESLPTTDIDPNTIYMILSGTSATENVYNEFMYVNNAWELIGTSATDLTNYYTKAEVDGKLLLKASASDLTSHTGDTTIHVTTADKNKWNNQTYVFRYSSTALVASSTNSNALLDNTDNLKVGDKVIDSNGVLFSITAIDTQNSTFTIGTALIDLAQDSDVVHKSGNEYITDTKTFGKGTLIVDNSTGLNVHGEIKLNGSRSGYIVADNASDGVFDNFSCGISILLQGKGKPLHVGSYKVDSNGRVFVDNTNKNPVLTVRSNFIGSSILIPEKDTSDNVFIIASELFYANGDSSKALNVVFVQYDDANATSAIYSNTNNVTSLGTSTRKWSKIYGTEYYYGSNNVEFSTKFVTTDTAQTISGNKTFSSINGVEPSSLSLPSDRSARIDISSYLTDTSNGAVNRYTVPANGYIYLNVADVVSMHLLSQTSNNLTHYGDTKARGSVGQLYALLPVRKDDVFTSQWYTSATNVTLTSAFFIPCQGNI